MKLCPAGRAHCAWRGHFVACIPCLAETIFDGPPVGWKEDETEFRADFRPVEREFGVH